MICPYYKNSEVFNGFNEIIEALGGKPMTEEEFRNPELRNQRSGADYSAMEAAYRIYNRNGGNMLDMTPQGKPSVLFQTLLDHFCGDRTKAIVAKSNVYSDEFFNWFGNWTVDINNDYILKDLEEYISDGDDLSMAIKSIIDNFDLSNILQIYKGRYGRGMFSIQHGKLFIPDINNFSDIDKKGIKKLVLHELIHAVTAQYILQYDLENSANTPKEQILRIKSNVYGNIHLTDKQRNSIKRLYEIYNKVQNYIDSNKPDGFSVDHNDGDAYYAFKDNRDPFIFKNYDSANLIEFVAEVMSNRNLQKIMTDIDDGEKSIFHTFMGCINILLQKLNIKPSLLEETIQHIQNITVPKKENVSKVVDENGEPKVVYHGSKTKITIFDSSKSDARNELSKIIKPTNFFSDDRTVADAFAKTEKQSISNAIAASLNEVAEAQVEDENEVWNHVANSVNKSVDWVKNFWLNELSLKERMDASDGIMYDPDVENQKYQVFLNLRNPVIIDAKGERADKVLEENEDVINNNDEVIILNIDETVGKQETATDYLVRNSNQIKHVENLGTFNPNNQNIYKSTIDNTIDVDDSNIFKSTNLVDSFGNELTTKLLNGETVSSKDLMNAMISNGVFHPGQFKLADLMSKHDVPVRISNNMGVGELAETITDKGGSVILLNPKEVYNISRGYFGTTIIHELVHAVTVDIIDNPKTDEERAFVEQNRAVFQKLNTYFRKDGAIKFDALSGLHVLDNEKEFAAYFASDPNVRKNIFDLADAMDRGTKRGLFKRIQRLLNKFISAFISRSNIKEQSTREQVQEYEKALEDFLYDRPFIQKGNISSKSYLKAVYDEQNGAITNHENFIESMKLLEQMTTAQKNFVKLGNESYNIQIGKHKPGSVQITSWEEVKNSLSTRINALRGSNMDSVVKSRLLQITQNQLEMFAIDEAGKFLAVQNLLDTSIPQIIKDIENLKTIRRENGVFSNDDYMYHMHANLGMYNRVFDGIKKLIDDDHNRQEMVDAFNAKVIREEDKITVEDINEIERHLDNAKNFTEEGMNVVEYMLKENVIDKLKRIGNETGNPEMGDYINALNSTLASDMIDDIGQLESMAGSADSSTNEAVRTIAYMINKALTTATMNSAGKATDLLKLKENLKRGEHEWDIYETDEKGNFTGYLIRDLNFGRFYRDYQNEIRKINQDIRDIFDIPDLDLDHRTAPDIKKQVMINGVLMTPKEFFDNRKEDWLEKHAERRYKPEYYKQYSNLPQRVKDSLGEIRIQINSITQNYTDLYDEDGVPHYEKLSDEDWDRINVLWERRRSLRSDYDEYGNLKKGQDLEDARKLRELYETLYYNNADGSKKDKKYDKTGWLKIRNKIKSKYGENSEELRKWDERNSRKTLKKNSYGETIVFKKIEEEVGGRPSYGDEYEQLSKERTEHLNNYRLANGEVDANAMPDVIKNIIRKIDQKMDEIRSEKRASNKDFRKFASDYREVKDKYIRYVNTKQFEKILKAIEEEAKRRVAEAADDPLDPATKEDYMYAMLSGVYGEYKSYSDDLLGGEEFHPYSWLQTIEAIDEQYMDVQPNDAWIDKKDNDLLNPNFNEDYGTAWVPKRSLYDNSTKYNQIFGEGGSKTLQDLYNGVQQTLVESNDMYGRQYADNFLLPQKECTFLGRLRRKPFWAGIWYYIKRITSLGRSKKEDNVSTLGSGRLVGRYDDPNDTEIGQSVQEDINGNYNKVRGTYPDGRSFHIIPQYFSKRMKHPEYISRDVVDITASYYRMAEMYKQRSLVRNDCEAILDVLQRQQFSIGDGRTIGGIGNTESNTYKYAKDIIERDLYDIQRLPLSITMAGKTYDFGRILGLWKRWTTARNLGMNPKVAIVGFLTTSFTHILNGAVGYKYGRHEMWRANNIVLKEFGRSIFSEGTFIGSRLTKNRVMLLLEMMDMSNQLERKTEHSNRNRWLQAIYKNSTFGLLSAADISSKAVIAVSTFLSYRYVNGEFLTKHQIEESREAFGEDYDKIMEEFKNSKITLYDIFIDGDEKLQVDPKYQEAWDKVKNTAINKSIKFRKL